MESYKRLKTQNERHSLQKKTMGGSLTQVRALRKFRIEALRPDHASEQRPGTDIQSSSSTAHHK
jgi:hypothetical protein